VNFYRLYINTENENIYQKVSEILNVKPTLFDKENDEKTLWCYGIDEENEDDYIDFINLYLDILEPKFTKLKEIGIKRSEISIWRIYEYEHQCAMEITPQEMKRLGNNEITLCIDCFQK
jgi:hypothetical protein